MPKKLPPKPPQSQLVTPFPRLAWIHPDHNRIPQVLDRPPATDPVLRGMIRDGVKIDRENYINRAYGATPPGDWTLGT
jgi:hypothetical protein